MTWDREMMRAIEADGEKLRQMTGEDHGPLWLETCPNCDGAGVTSHRVAVHEAGCAFPHDDTDERKCVECDGFGTILIDGGSDA